MRWLRQWAPLILLLGLIWVLSTLLFSADSTGRVVFPALRKLIPAITAHELREIHYWMRKLAHVCVYFVLSFVLLRALRRGRPGWRLSWALGALGLVMAIALLDELHQYYVPGRGSSIRDVILDTAAAALAQVFAWHRARRQPRLPESSSTAEPAS